MLSLTELEQIYKATCEDLERLRHIERYTLEEQSGNDITSSNSEESTSFYQMLHGLQQRRTSSFKNTLSPSMKFSGGISSEQDSFSVMSRNSGQPLIHVENYYVRDDSFNQF